METSHSKSGTIRVSASATPAEAAAIIAAIEQDVTSTKKNATESAETVQNWGFAGRIESITGFSDRPPRQLPTGKWRAASRLER